MQPTTVKIEDQVGETLFLNCGFIVQTGEATTIHIGGHVVIFGEVLHSPIDAAQKFADLLTDVTE